MAREENQIGGDAPSSDGFLPPHQTNKPMKRFVIMPLILLGLCLFMPALMHAQDGAIFSAQPPIVVRPGNHDGKIYFTNTGDRILHGITLNNKDSSGAKTSKVIIDTIEPHKTVAV